jgi:hypothetical protein
MKSRRRSVLFAVILAGVGSERAIAHDAWTGPPILSTSGQAILRVEPDRAFVDFSSEGRAASATQAQQAETKAMTAMRQQVQQAGIPDTAVRTLAYDLQLEFDYVGGKQTPRGYVARHSIEVRVDDIAKLGDLVGRVVESGAAAVSGIRFDVKARDDLEREAVRKAVEDARARADAAAAGAGMTVASVVRIDEQRSFDGPRPKMMGRAMAAEMAASAPPIAAGEIEIHGVVTLTVALK